MRAGPPPSSPPNLSEYTLWGDYASVSIYTTYF